MNNLFKKLGLKGESDDSSVKKEYEGMWSLPLSDHRYGQYSYAVVRGNPTMEDYSEVDVCPIATFAGIYDGNNGYVAAHYVCNNIVSAIIDYARQFHGLITVNEITQAFKKVEQDFREIVRANHGQETDICETGTSALLVLVYACDLWVANLGDSKAVLGVEHGKKNIFFPTKIKAEQVTEGHGRSRSIGNLIRKEPQIAAENPHQGAQVQEPVITSIPDVKEFKIEPHHRFIVLASRGLWDHLSDQQVVDLVVQGPRSGIAEKIVLKAIDVAASKPVNISDKSMSMSKDKSVSIAIHDDMTVIVIFFDHPLEKANRRVEDFGIQAFGTTIYESRFRQLYGYTDASTSGTSGT